MNNTPHSHGSPALECTIWNCRYPTVQFLCSTRLTDDSYCVLPGSHDDDHENENRVSLAAGWDDSEGLDSPHDLAWFLRDATEDLASRPRPLGMDYVTSVARMENGGAAFLVKFQTGKRLRVTVTEEPSVRFYPEEGEPDERERKDFEEAFPFMKTPEEVVSEAIDNWGNQGYSTRVQPSLVKMIVAALQEAGLLK